MLHKILCLTNGALSSNQTASYSCPKLCNRDARRHGSSLLWEHNRREVELSCEPSSSFSLPLAEQQEGLTKHEVVKEVNYVTYPDLPDPELCSGIQARNKQVVGASRIPEQHDPPGFPIAEFWGSYQSRRDEASRVPESLLISFLHLDIEVQARRPTPQVQTASWPGLPSRCEGHRASRNILERRENRCSSAGQFEGAGKDAILRAYMRHRRGSGCAKTSPGLHDEEDANQFRNSGGCSLFHSGSGAPGNNTNTSRWCHFT